MNGDNDALRILSVGHPNVLIIGSDRRAEEVLEHLRPCLAEPVHTCQLPGALKLSGICHGTLLLRNVGALCLEQQQQLLDWLDEPGQNVQVISISSQPLFARVQRGTFNARLYYRLNTVFEEVEVVRDVRIGSLSH